MPYAIRHYSTHERAKCLFQGNCYTDLSFLKVKVRFHLILEN